MLQTLQRWFAPSKSEAKNCLKVFLLAAITTTIFFLPFIIWDHGLFIFYGDYNVQQIPFYQSCHEAVRNGNFGWSWTTDLGSNFIGSYSFYLLGSPFFWLTIPFPTSWIPYLMMPLFVLKFATAATTSYVYIRRFTKTAEAAILGAMMYAFSSFMIYDIFFNHFHDVAAFFPLMLIGLEELVQNNRKGLFALAVGLNLMINYFFFVGQVVFLILYFFFRCLCPDFRITVKKFLFLATESIMGCLIGMVLFLPAALAISGNPRVDSFLYGFNMLFYNNVQRYGLIGQSFFFPADMPARPNFFPDSNAKWGSVAAWLPLFGMTGVLTFLREKKRSWLKHLIIVLIVMAFVPFLNSAFFAFNSSYYARWFYMLTLMMALATVHVVENRRMNAEFGLKAAFFITLAFAVIGIIPTKEDGEVSFFSAPSYPILFWINVLIALLCLCLVGYLFSKYRRSRKRMYRGSLIAICFVTIISSVVQIAFGRMQNVDYVYTNIVDQGLNAEFQLDDSEFYRIDVYDGMDNWPMYWQIPTIQAFHSIVPPSIMEFYPSMGISRDVGSRPEPEYYGLRSLLSVKYIFVENNENIQKENPNLPPNCVLYDNQNGFDIYENLNFLPMGFTYDSYVNDEQYEQCYESARDRLLLNAIYLTDEQIEKYGDLLTQYNGVTSPGDGEIAAACQERRKESCTNFQYDSYHFSADISLSKDNLVFFSVPYESGWSATVNGEPVEIEKVNHGFMAVKCEAGSNIIRFTYHTPGLSAGILLTGVGILLLAIYLIFCHYLARKNPATYGFDPNGHRDEVYHSYHDPVYSDMVQGFRQYHPTLSSDLRYPQTRDTENPPEKTASSEAEKSSTEEPRK